MTYWKLFSPLLLINASFFQWAQRVFEKRTERKTNFCLIQGHWVASCKALYLPLGSAFLLDILSLMNCHSSHLRSHRGSRTLLGHTHSSLTGQSGDSSCQASFALRKPQLTGAGIFVCVLPSLISDHTHLFTCDRQPLPLGRGPVTPATPPLVFSAALRHLCVVRRKSRKTGGTSESTAGTEHGGPPLQLSYITVRHLAIRSHEEHHSLFCWCMWASCTVNMDITENACSVFAQSGLHEGGSGGDGGGQTQLCTST